MANVDETLSALAELGGSKWVAIVDSNSGMILGQRGSAAEIEITAAGNTEVMRANRSMVASLNMSDKIEDIIITLSSQYHIMRPIAADPSIFLYLVLNRAKSNLALARQKIVASGDALAL
ncbi:MAG: hypothetical protein RL499_937 [Actinomycetota bacterium]